MPECPPSKPEGGAKCRPRNGQLHAADPGTPNPLVRQDWSAKPRYGGQKAERGSGRAKAEHRELRMMHPGTPNPSVRQDWGAKALHGGQSWGVDCCGLPSDDAKMTHPGTERANVTGMERGGQKSEPI
ncbi:hypothetical protein FRC06_003775, partial [Ceratobasidium sp. 370]